MSQLTVLASCQLSDSDAVTVVLSQPDAMPASVIIHWAAKPTVIEPQRFGDSAAALVKMFAEAHIALARIKARRKL
jgi:hypothetical protein